MFEAAAVPIPPLSHRTLCLRTAVIFRKITPAVCERLLYCPHTHVGNTNCLLLLCYLTKILSVFLVSVTAICHVTGPSASRINNWQVEDIAENLAADLDGSLSGLGVDLNAAPYNMR